jgi:nitrite reductase/ring-hydroxylating ferredoxin subunit
MARPACTPGPISAGKASSYGVGGTPQYFSGSGHETYVQRDSGGLYCVTATCPHQGCTVNGDTSGFSCPCHGWTFDINGGKTGVARSGLVHYAMCVDPSGNVTVDPSTTVSATERY